MHLSTHNLVSPLLCHVRLPHLSVVTISVQWSTKKYDMKRFRSIAVYSDNEANLEVVKVYTKTLK